MSMDQADWKFLSCFIVGIYELSHATFKFYIVSASFGK